MEQKFQTFSEAESQARQDIMQGLTDVLGELNENFIGDVEREKQEVNDLLFSSRGVKKGIMPFIEIDYPPDNQQGDFSVPCFILANRQKKSPAEVAKSLAAKFQPLGIITQATATGPYVNFKVDRAKFSELLLREIAKKKDKYGSSKIGKGKKIMVEYFSPNTNKPLTIGHIRNICLGFSISHLLKFTGHKVIQSTIYNDRGIALAKAILGYKKWGKGQTPKDAKMKPDHFVGQFYVKAAQAEAKNKNIEAEIKRILQAWEDGKEEIKKIWQLLQAWALDGFDETLEKLGIGKFDEEYYESEFYTQGKEIVERGLKDRVFEKDKDGVTLARLQKFDLPNKILLRPDDTSLYITQDLYLAKLKDKYKPDVSLYVVGSEQDLYFKQLFKILELLDFGSSDKYYHLSYGMIRLPEGKIKSREGLPAGTGADEIITKLEGMAMLEIKKRNKNLSKDEIRKRAEKIALAALKYYILSVKPKTTMIFDPQKSLSFTGQTGPYLQYVYARINSIFRRGKVKLSARVDYNLLKTDEEFELISTLSKFPKIIESTVKNYDPSDLTLYLYDLAKIFSTFYEKVPVLKTDDKTKKARLFLISNVQQVLATGLELLGIKTLEKM